MTRNQTNHHDNDRTNHLSFFKFHGTVKILRPVENCGPSYHVIDLVQIHVYFTKGCFKCHHNLCFTHLSKYWH